MLYPLSYGRMSPDRLSDCMRIADPSETAEISGADPGVPPWIVPICGANRRR
jgi:hypothetical protein